VLIIGLCGSSGSGKNTVADLFMQAGIPSLDTDRLYHALIGTDSACARELIAAFGQGIARADGAVDRALLREMVFGAGADAEEKRARLNHISHRHVWVETEKWLDNCRQNGDWAACINAPLLFESGYDARCDVTVAVLSPFDTKLRRIMARDGLARRDAERRLRAQLSDEALWERADYVLHNDRDMTHLAQQTNLLIKKLKENQENREGVNL